MCALGMLVLLSGCPNAPAETDGGTGGSGGGGGCMAGTIGCECAAGACSTGECVSGQCVDCQRGASSCACLANNTCNTGLRCSNSVCETCPAGQQGCACGAGDSCTAGLVCMGGNCVADTCTPGRSSCPCRTNDPKCDGNAYCDGTSLCRTCSPDVANCPCDSNSTCLGGLVCNMATMRCRASVSCSDLRSDGGCGSNQACSQTPGTDAVCTPMACEANYKWDPRTNSCVMCTSSGCANEPTCDVDGGIGGMCDADNRGCVQSGVTAYCGDCKAGFTQNSANVCVPVPLCGTATCAVDQYCDTAGGAPVCRMLPCPAGQAKNGPAGTCTACTRMCTGAGFSGRIWPFKTNLDVCVCETVTGYFLPSGGVGQAIECDGDGDGWVRQEADDSTTRVDPALSANSRCNIRRVDRVKLVEESGLTAEVHSCVGSMNLLIPQERLADGGNAPLNTGISNPDGGGYLLGDGGISCPTSVLSLRLLESERNDVPGRAMGTKAPLYNTTGSADAGRLLEARELNALTKGCVTTVADYNDNQQDDLIEVQPLGASSDDQVRLQSFAHYMELYTAHYEGPPAGGTLGALVIRERSRCNADFPLHYDTGATYLADGGVSDRFDPDAGSSFWRSCDRRRDPLYSQAMPVPGRDFAQWTCLSATGSCPWQQAFVTTTAAPTNPSTTILRNIGLCAAQGQQAFDRRWRGFGHHSQFKCVSISSSAPANNPASYEQPPAEFGGATNQYTFNACSALPCVAGDASCRTQPGAGAQTSQPIIRCQARTTGITGGMVGFAAVNYRPYGFNFPSGAGANYTGQLYLGGCVAEDAETNLNAAGGGLAAYRSYFCPYPEYSMDRTRSDAAFGRHSCYGRGANFLWSGSTPQRATLKWNSNSTIGPNGVLR